MSDDRRDDVPAQPSGAPGVDRGEIDLSRADRPDDMPVQPTGVVPEQPDGGAA